MTNPAESEGEFKSPLLRPSRALGLGVKDFCGDHYVPLVGAAYVKDFNSSSRVKKVFDLAKEELSRLFSFTTKVLQATTAGSHGGFSCCISDPRCEDCPLVYTSRIFDEMTGYPSEFACGRSCRFLQPGSKIINDAFNAGERARMSHFCATPRPGGTTKPFL